MSQVRSYIHDLLYRNVPSKRVVVEHRIEEMIIPFVAKAAVQSAAALTQSPAAFIAAIPRGGAVAAAAAFDMGLAKTRLEGLAYGTVTALM
jgi:tetrahydromethanopterin S-methyltransferase subunit F